MRAFDRERLTRQLREGAAALPVMLSDAQIVQLVDYLALLHKWNAVYNLTAVREPEQMVTQHLLDSLAVLPFFAAERRVLDVGAGGGLPGIVLAIAQPDLQVTLIDTVQKKTAFLTQVKSQLKLDNVTVQTGRVEQWRDAAPFDAITSRAFAELADFVQWSSHLLKDGGRFIALKGVLPAEEIRRLPVGWRVRETAPIEVPGMQAERHVIIIERNAA